MGGNRRQESAAINHDDESFYYAERDPGVSGAVVASGVHQQRRQVFPFEHIAATNTFAFRRRARSKILHVSCRVFESTSDAVECYRVHNTAIELPIGWYEFSLDGTQKRSQIPKKKSNDLSLIESAFSSNDSSSEL